MKYLDALLEHSEWTRHVVKAADPRVCHLDRVAHFMVMRRPVLSVTHKSLELIWSLHSEPQAAGCAKMEKALSEVRCSLHNHSIATGMVADVKQTNGEHPGQEAEVRFEKSGLVRPLLRLSLPKDPSYLQTGAIRGCWKLANNDGCLCISLPRSSVQAENMPPILPTVADVQLVVLEHQRPHLIMMEECQLRVDDLRRRLDESLAAFQRATSRRDTKPRALHIVRQNNLESLVEISNPGERARFDRLMASSPLNVICCNGTTPAVATSPADSTDSGVAVSPLSSPLSSMKHSPFYQYSEQSRIGMRQRSASECADWDGIVLKSILKKPQRIDRFSRSISESHHFPAESMHLSLLMESTTEVDESGDDHDCQPIMQRKKRVSFSEKVQERRFRVGQCILTAAKKTEKKRAYRKRKEERQRSLSEDDQNLDAKENSVSSTDADIDEKPGRRTEREDSGFVDGEENDYEGDEDKPAVFTPNDALMSAEDRWKNIVRQQRQVSAI